MIGCNYQLDSNLISGKHLTSSEGAGAGTGDWFIDRESMDERGEALPLKEFTEGLFR